MGFLFRGRHARARLVRGAVAYYIIAAVRRAENLFIARLNSLLACGARARALFSRFSACVLLWKSRDI